MATSLRIETQTVHGAHSSLIPLPLTPPSKLHPNLRETLPHSVILFFHTACVPLTPAPCSEFLWLFSSGTNTCPGFASTALGHTAIQPAVSPSSEKPQFVRSRGPLCTIRVGGLGSRAKQVPFLGPLSLVLWEPDIHYRLHNCLLSECKKLSTLKKSTKIPNRGWPSDSGCLLLFQGDGVWVPDPMEGDSQPTVLLSSTGTVLRCTNPHT